MTYQVIEEPGQFEGCWFSEYAEDSIIKPDWFKESDKHGILSACSPSRPIDLSYLDDPNSWSLTDDTGVVWASDEERKAMWTHYCKPEKTEIQTAYGQPNWCDKLS